MTHGPDNSNIEHVVDYDLPKEKDTYVHEKIDVQFNMHRNPDQLMMILGEVQSPSVVIISPTRELVLKEEGKESV